MKDLLTALTVAAAAGWLAAAALAPAARRGAGLRACAWLSGAAGLAAVGGGVLLAVHGSGATLRFGAGPVGGASFTIAPLAAPFIALLGAVAAANGLYAPRYHHPGVGTSVYLVAYNLALLSSLAVLVAGNVVAFLVAWESMALTCYLLILRYHERPGVGAAAFLFVALSEVGFALIVLAFAILAVQTGTMNLATIAARASSVSEGWRAAAYVLALVGFGFKAGLVPLHIWLPAAHPVAPADGSAFLSGLIIKLGVYGIALFGFELLRGGPAWWGLLTMAFGAVSAVLGILYALMERDLKRFLAFSSIENVGIIVTGLGAGMTFTAYGQPAIGTFLLIAALYHTVNHGVYKTLLFQEAGVIEHATGTRDLDRLGGLIRRLPRTAVICLVGTLAIAALPPFNGFVSEWMLFQGLFQGFRIADRTVGILIVIAGAAIALTGGLALNAFARAYGIPFLGMPRSQSAARASERRAAGRRPGAARVGVRVPRRRCARLCSPGLIGWRAQPPGCDIHSELLVPRAERDPCPHELLGVLADIPDRVPARHPDRADPDLAGWAPARCAPASAGVGRRHRLVQAAHAVHRDDARQPGTRDVRGAVSAKRASRARLRRPGGAVGPGPLPRR